MGIFPNGGDPGNANAAFGDIEPKIAHEADLSLFLRMIRKESRSSLGRKLPDNKFRGQSKHEFTDRTSIFHHADAN